MARGVLSFGLVLFRTKFITTKSQNVSIAYSGLARNHTFSPLCTIERKACAGYEVAIREYVRFTDEQFESAVERLIQNS